MRVEVTTSFEITDETDQASVDQQIAGALTLANTCALLAPSVRVQYARVGVSRIDGDGTAHDLLDLPVP